MNDKSLEEILGLLQAWPESFQKRFGRKPTKTELINHLNKAYDEAIERQLRSTFDSFSPVNLLTAIDELKNGEFDFIEHDLHYPIESKGSLFDGLNAGIENNFNSFNQSLTGTAEMQEVVKEPSKTAKKSKHKWMPNF